MVQQESDNTSRRQRRRTQETSDSQEEASAMAGTSDAEQSEQEPADPTAIETEGQSEDGQGEGVAERAHNRKERRTAAAQARAARRREQAEAEAVGLDAKEIVDDALIRLADKTGKGLRQYAGPLQWVVSLGVLGWMGIATYTWFAAKENAEASDVLGAATAAEFGKVGDPELAGKPGPQGVVDPTPIFETAQARSQEALAKYEAARTAKSGTGAEAFALLGKAGLLFETAQYEEALEAYRQASQLSIAQEAPQLLGAALEGEALTLQAKGDNEAAVTVLERLQTVAGFELPAKLQTARLQHSLGKSEQAWKLLNEVFKALGPPPGPSLGGLPNPPEFLRTRAEQLVSVVDPMHEHVTVPSVEPGAAAVEQLMRQLEQQGQLTRPETP